MPSGAPALPDPPGEGAEESPSAAEVPAPSASELAAFEDEQREHAEWLESPEAKHQRETSQSAYTSLTAGEAQALLVEAFPQQLKALNADPARVLSTLEVEKPLGTYGALVSDEEGESAILNSSVPVQSDLGGQGKEPVDLALEQSGSSFVPQNPITEVELPGSAEEPIQLQSGIEIELPTSDDHGAEPLGDMNLFYPETETATDTLVAPKAGGVEVFEQLRSPESPERFSFALNLPKEAKLRMSEAGGAEIVASSGKTIGEVRPPSATDAQGATVPVTTSIEGDSLVLEVSHRSREVAYPVLLDPEWVTDTTSFGEWTPSLNSGYEYYLNNNWSSLDAISRGHYYYPANTHGQWAWGAYGTTAYIAAATFSPVDYIVHTCQTYEPHGYIGLYNPGWGGYDALGIWATGASEGPYETGWKGNTGTRDAIIGIGTSGAGVEIGCAHELYVGGYSIQEKDPEAPTVNSATGIPGGWAKEFTVTPHASDPGLGVKAITLSPEGSSPHTNSQGCTGANGSRCPGSWETSFGFSYFFEGERSASVTAYDPLGPDVASHVSASYPFTTRLDRQKPEVKLEGEFTQALEEAEEEGEGKKAPALHLPVYNLKIEATDKANEGNPKTEPKARRSGVKNIAVFLDGKEMKVPWEAQGCSGPEYSCPMVKTYPVPMDEVQGGGVHHLKVVATDQVGNEREEEINFEYFPATGMKDEYVMQHFPLPDGEGNESEEEDPKRPELAVNVTNGNLVYRQKDVEATGPAVDLEVERDYNSQLPEEDNTQWGDGWTLAQTPKLEPEETKEEAPPAKASMVRTSGVLESTVGLPTESGGTQFDKKLQAVVTKEPGGGYTVADQSGETESTLAFNEAGNVTQMQTPGSATVNYSYEAGKLSEIAVDDPATAGGTAEKEAKEASEPTYASSFGSHGSGNGQLSEASDLAVDPASGSVWVADTMNSRLEEFSPGGEFIRTVGSHGSGNAQFEGLYGVAIDSKGNVWASNCGDGHIEEFNSKGEYITKFGSAGSGNAQFNCAEGLAIDYEGHLFIADRGNHRVQELNEKGEYIKSIGTSGEGTLKSPADVVLDSSGDLFVSDYENNRIVEFNHEGSFVRAWGEKGSAEGKLSSAYRLCIGPEGNLWVAEWGNSRVQVFTPEGKYLYGFGTQGSGEGQFNHARGIGFFGSTAYALDSGTWESSTNNRVEVWPVPVGESSVENVPVEADPKVEVNVSSGLVTSVEGEAAGQTTYSHEGELLTAVQGPETEASYEYDEAKRLKKVSLPNGTWGEVKYDSYGRVESVTVSVEGAKAKKTSFTYKDEPRRTTVSPEGEPATVYDIAPDGSVLKWWNTAVAPEIENLSGSLYASKETEKPIEPGDYELLVQAFAAEGIASINIVANGSQLVDEKTCTKTAETNCKTVEDPWVTNTGNWPPGIIQLEVIVTDANHNTESAKFWVNIPYTPPPNPEVEEPPTFEEVLHFREEFGLDLDLKGNEIAIDERIFNLIGDWYNPHTPAGEVARATAESWGVPLRAVDAAEMEYRERYITQAATAIPQWASANGATSAYAGYYVDHRAGGIIYVGFTSSQEARVAGLKSTGGLIAPDRVRPFPIQPTYSIAYLESLQLEVVEVSEAPTAMGGAKVNIQNNRVDVGATNVAEVESFLKSHFGAGAPINVYYEAASERPSFKRIKASPTGPVKAGEMLGSTVPGNPEGVEEECSVGWGAWDKGGVKPDGSNLYRHFITTAGHCFAPGTEVKQWEENAESKFAWQRTLGYVRRYSFDKHPSNFATDAEAIRVEDPTIVPRLIRRSDTEFTRINGSTAVTEGMVVCRAGQYSPRITCRKAEWPPKCERWGELRENGDPVLCTIRTEIPIQPGDSGGPFWERATGDAVGTLTGGLGNIKDTEGAAWFTPVEEIPGYPKAPGSLNSLGVEGEPLHIVKWKP